MRHVDEVLKRWPNTGEAWFIRGRGLEGKGLLEEALTAFAKGVQYAPYDAQVNLGYLRGMLVAWERDLQTINKTPEQLAQLAQLREQADLTASLLPPSDAEGQLVLGYAYRSTEQLEKAMVAFENAARQPQFTIPATLQLSVCYDNLELHDDALSVLEELRENYPDNAEVANSLGYYLAEKGVELEKAERLIAQALQEGPGTGAYLDSMGWVLFQQGKTDEAFDFIHVGAAAEEIPESLVRLMKNGGRMVLPVGDIGGIQHMTIVEKDLDGQSVTFKKVMDVRYVPLVK